MSTDPKQTVRNAQSDTKVALVCVAAAVSMVGVSFAAVPLYQMFCQATGLGGTTQRALKPSDVVLDRVMTVRFDANVSPKLGWTFEPMQRTVDAHIGENMLVFYRATNMTDRTIKGTATFNVAPDAAGLYFSKIECFCFTEQTLAPGESIEMPVSFFIDPAIVKDAESSRLRELTLSYTFYPVEGGTSAGQASVDTADGNRS